MNEQSIERELITWLEDNKYVHRPEIIDRNTLEGNFRKHFETLNQVRLTDGEFKRLLEMIVTPDVYAASKMLRERNSFERDDGTPLHYELVNTKDWCKNTFEVIDQIRFNTDNSHHRYDVMLLINGIPVVQIELKNLSISPRNAMRQIIKYKSDPGNSYQKTLLCFLQIFIVSNRTDTVYFANNNQRHFSFNADERFLPVYRYADQANKKINNLYDFTTTFLNKCTLGQMISRYMVLVASEQKLMIMRPYQIYAVKALVECVEQDCGNGYIWHTTGSGKTLTSFKASTLLKDNDAIDKCLFVVDRKDLDRQTREEFNRFQEGAVEENTDTRKLVQRLLSTDYADKIIVTTIQKLGRALDPRVRDYKQRLEPLRDKRIVFIFDECHRSQFGENHAAIRDFFPNAQLFGFTGTPIFDENATYQQVEGQQASYKTTEAIFQRQLHAYTITDAIEDNNVLRFHVEYYGLDDDHADQTLTKQAIASAIIEKHDAVTVQRKFNALFATASIKDAIEYYELFAQLQADHQAADPEFRPLNIACVFSPPANGDSDVRQIQEDLPQERLDNQQDPEHKKAALQRIIADYNASYGTNHQISEFDLYYQDVQQRIKDHQYPNQDWPHAKKIDVVIVVDMLLTGFDSKYLNTLYVDKNLKYHGLIQAFSRTNRVLNDTKPFGNILDFRSQEPAVNDAIKLFSGQHAARARTIWLVDAADEVIPKFTAAVDELAAFMQSLGLDFAPEEVANIKGDAARARFIELFKEVQRSATRLDQYTDLAPEQEQEIEQKLPSDVAQAFRGAYLEVAQQLKQQQEADDPAPEIQQLELELVLFSSAIIDYDYIMQLIATNAEKPQDKQLSPDELIALIASDAKFIDERDLLSAYIKTLPTNTRLNEGEIRAGYQRFKQQHNEQELAAIAAAHGLELATLQAFVDAIFERMIFDAQTLNALFAPFGLGWRARTERELALMNDLIPLLHRRAAGREIAGLDGYYE